MLTFLKDARHYTDPFIAGQRAACTVAGLTGTLLFPIISAKLGLVRTGSWSIWSVDEASFCNLIFIFMYEVRIYVSHSRSRRVIRWRSDLKDRRNSYSRVERVSAFWGSVKVYF
jgi:hypothetical protein